MNLHQLRPSRTVDIDPFLIGAGVGKCSAGERQTGHGLVIPATASIGKRLAWAAVVATGQHVRQVQIGDRVLYDPEDRAEVELHSKGYVLLRERDIHAVAAPRVEADPTGLYL